MKQIPYWMFGRPTGLLGRAGGMLMAKLNPEVTRWVMALLDIQPGDRVLDVGCGPGTGVNMAAEHATQGFVAGVDPSPVMLEQAHRRNTEVIEGGGAEDSFFDKALTMNSLQIWPDPLAGLHEIHRVLKPGGLIAVSFTKSMPEPRG